MDKELYCYDGTWRTCNNDCEHCHLKDECDAEENE